MIYLAFFSAVAGLLAIFHLIIEELNGVNLTLFILFGIIAFATAIMERDLEETVKTKTKEL